MGGLSGELSFAFLLLSLLASAFCQIRSGTVYYNTQNQSYSFKSGIVDKSGVAFGTFEDTLMQIGWGVLRIKTNNKYDDNVQYYAAGYLEGALTYNQIYPHYQNMYNFYFGNYAPTQKLYDWLATQDSFVTAHISGGQLSDFWAGMKLIMNQFHGLMDGYNAVVDKTKQLPLFAFQLLNDVGDFLDLLSALDPSRIPDYDKMTPDEIFRTITSNGRCSAMVKLNGDMSEMWSSHSSWFTYAATNRIFKHYYFDVSSKFVSAKKISFASYPGFLESLDDFYIMDNGLVMLQTTNSILNSTLYQLVTPNALLAWQRVRLACQNAGDGKAWSEIIASYNSGTYNNQYIVVDYNKFVPGTEVQPGTLWVSEQIPGLVVYDDVTDQLERGYWASYNVPYFPDIYQQSGYPDFVKKYGVQFSYQMAPRAEIFRRDQGKVVDMQTFKDIMRYNDYKNDPYSKGDPDRAICSRGDLRSSGASPGGCYDTKVTSSILVQGMLSQVINGPTTYGNLPPFDWSKFPYVPHVGLPSVYNFTFVLMNPNWDKF